MSQREYDPNAPLPKSELVMLREFFDLWTELHQIRCDANGQIGRLVRMRLEAAAQNLAESADEITDWRHKQKEAANG